MIKFEEHDGMLFKMLDEPVPLKENDENVLVRFITHGIIGEYVMEHWLDCNQKNLPIYIEDVDSDGDVTVLKIAMDITLGCPFPMFEIIGTLVKEGSAEWALYQMMQGNRVTKTHLEHTYWHYDARPHLQCISEYNCGTLQIMVLPEIWLTTAEPTGWKIYTEPEPQYKVGDWVEYRLDGDTYYGKICNIRGYVYYLSVTTEEIPKDQARAIMLESIIRKLSPSEIVVRIGCLSGTIEDLSYAENGKFWFIGRKTEMYPYGMYCILYLEMLDTPTRELVKSLLKAQKIKKTKEEEC